MNKLRTAVVGVGHQGKWHAEKFAALENSDLVAVVDKDADRCRTLAAELNVKPLADFKKTDRGGRCRQHRVANAFSFRHCQHLAGA